MSIPSVDFVVLHAVENIPVKVQNGACNSWSVTTFTMQFDHELEWKFKKVTKVNIEHVWENNVKFVQDV